MMSIERYKKLDKLLKPKKNKYNARQTIIDGIKFPSKKESQYYVKLRIDKENGVVRLFLRQVPFHLPGNIKYLADFMVINHDGTIEFIDVKGRDTPMSRLKRKQVAQLYGVEIKIV